MLFVVPEPGIAAIGEWQRGAAIQPRWDGDFGSESFKRSLDDLKGAGGNYVALIIPYYQQNQWAIDIGRGWNTPTDASLIAGINYARSIGLKVALKIHMESYDGAWRAHIDPYDKDAWFRTYTDILTHYGRMGAAHGVDQMVIGAELIKLATNRDNAGRWGTLIGSIRSVFPGTLTYSANWGGGDFEEETPDVVFWGALDYIGISAYYPLGTGSNNSVDALKGAWDYWNWNKVKPISDQYGKQVLFTEVGYRSVNDAHSDPWNYWRGGWFDETEQANDYTALFSYWNDHSYMRGGFLWDWSSDPNAGGQGDTGFTPQNKRAEQVMRDWFGSAPTPTPTPQPTNASFSATGSASPAGVAKNQPTTLQTTVTAASAASNVIIDVEVRSSSNEKVFQKFYEGESFTANQSKTYTVSWTPEMEGNYTVIVGVFNSTWTTAHFWGNVASVTVQGTTPPPSSGPVTFTGTGSATPATASPNQAVTLAGTVTNGVNPASGAVVDIEVYSSAGNKLFQKLYEGESFTANQSKTYTTSFATPDVGSYTMKLGVFNSNWSTNYYWNDSAATFTVSGSGGGGGSTTTPPAPTGPATIDIWWPGDGSHVSGLQPFKAMIPNRDISTYSMFWQVDGDRLNDMYDSQEGYPHKEALVDLSGWNWKGADPYTITFIAKEGSGSTLTTKSVNIFVP